MTKESAAEVILEGKVYVSCFSCKGSGAQRQVTLTTRNQVMFRKLGIEEKRCDSCDGVGLRRSQQYLNACRVLGLPEPSRPKKGLRY